MTRVPLPTDVIRGASVADDRLSQVPGTASGVIIPPASTIGQTIANAGADIGDALASVGGRLLEADRSRQLTELRKQYRLDIDAALTHADTVEPGQAEQAFTDRVNEMMDSQADIGDSVLRDRASELLTRLSTDGAIKARRNAATRTIELSIAAVNDLSENIRVSIGSGQLDADEGIDEVLDAVDDLTSSGALSATEGQAYMQQTSRRLLLEQYERLLADDPGRAAIFAESNSLFQEFFTGEERRRRVQAADDELTDRMNRDAEALFGQARTDIGALIHQEGVINGTPMIVQAFQDFASNRGGGFDVAGRFVRDRVATEGDLAYLLLSDHLEVLAAAGDEERFNAVAGALRSLDSNSARTLEAIGAGRVKIERLRERKTQLEMHTDSIRLAYINNDTASDLPNDPDALNRFYKAVRPNASMADIAGFIASHPNLSFPTELQRDFANLFERDSLDLRTAALVMQSMSEAGGETQMRNMLLGVNDPSIARTLHYRTRGLAPIDPRFDDTIDLLQNPAAPRMMQLADTTLIGTPGDDESGLDIGTSLKETIAVDNAALGIDVIQKYRAEFRHAFLDAAINGNAPVATAENIGNIAAGASKQAAGSIRDGYAAFELNGTRYLVPTSPELNVGSIGNRNDRTYKAFSKRLDEFQNDHMNGGFLRSGFFRSADATVRPDLAMSRLGRAYIPALGNDGAVEFMEHDPLNQTFKRIGRGHELFDTLSAELNNRSSGRTDRLAHLRFDPAYGVRSLAEFDRRYANSLPEGGMRNLILQEVERQFQAEDEDGRLPDYDNEQDALEVKARAMELARRLGWPIGDSTQ